MIYLDNAATTQIYEEVLEEMLPFLKNEFGNPSSKYELGINARKAVDKAREQVACLINANPNNIVFTASGSEANAMALNNIGKLCISSCMEHDSILKNLSPVSRVLPYLEENELINKLSLSIPSFDGVAIMFVNNELGIKNPIKEIGNICRKKSVLFHTDCVQALGHDEIDVDKIGCDTLSISSHKIHGPKGVGALYIKNPSSFKALINGSQESGIRGGTENVPAIVGFGKACELALNNFDRNKLHINKLRKIFIDNLKCNYVENFYNEDSKIISLRIKGVDSETLVLALAANGVMISSGSACRNLESEPSKALISFGLTPDEARETIRISLSDTNTIEEIKRAAEIVSDISKIFI